MAALNDFEIQDNLLDGTISTLTGLSNLQYFFANNNRLTGAFPDLSGTALRDFRIGNNRLTGPVSQVAALTSMYTFQIGGNHLSGVLPDPPNPSYLFPGLVTLCPNDFPASSYIDNATWDGATTVSPWYKTCDKIFSNGFEP